MRIDGKVALVTGGASGLGLATARMFLDGGASALIVDLPTSEGEAAAKELGDRARFAPADVTSESDVQAAVDAAGELGGLHCVVNCAGVATPGRVLTRDGSPIDLERFAQTKFQNLFCSRREWDVSARRLLTMSDDLFYLLPDSF